MLEAKRLLEKQDALLQLRFIKRGYRIDMEQIRTYVTVHGPMNNSVFTSLQER